MAKSLRVIVLLVAEAASVTTGSAQELWSPDRRVPLSNDLVPVAGATFHVIKRREPELDGYNWLHGVALAWHNGRLYASFGHNRGAENTAGEEARVCISEDGGQSWGNPSTIDAGDEPELAVSHGVFLAHPGELWAFHGAFYGRMRDVHTRAYVLNHDDDTWTQLGVVMEGGFWPMQAPQRMDDGNWIMAGLSVTDGYGGPNDPAAVAVSAGNDFTQWKLVRIPKQPSLEMWGESTVIVNGPNVLNIARWRNPTALVSRSTNFGLTWTECRSSNLPMAASKPYAGILSTGQRYLIATTTADSGNRRSPLTIAVSGPDGLPFRRIFRIRGAEHDGPGESHPEGQLSYPYAVEHDGKLYVGYSNDGSRGGNRNSAELAILPVASLAIE